jgi:DNA polymerase-3 subunit chi
VWITDQNELKPGAELLFLVEGGSTEISDLAGLERCILIFDGADETAVSSARDFWKEAKEAAHNVTYWKQSAAGKWEKQG